MGSGCSAAHASVFLVAASWTCPTSDLPPQPTPPRPRTRAQVPSLFQHHWRVQVRHDRPVLPPDSAPPGAESIQQRRVPRPCPPDGAAAAGSPPFLLPPRLPPSVPTSSSRVYFHSRPAIPIPCCRLTHTHPAGPHFWDECPYPPKGPCGAGASGDFRAYVGLFTKAADMMRLRPDAVTGEASSNTFTSAAGVYLRGPTMHRRACPCWR